MMENRPLPYLDFEVVNDPTILKDASIALYGASQREGETYAMLQALGLNVVALTDIASEKWGKPFNDLNIVSPEEMRSTLLAEKGKKYVISCIKNTNECYQFLSELFQNDDASIGFISFWGIDFCIHTHREEFAARSKDAAAQFEKEKSDDYIRSTQRSLQLLSKLSHKSNEILIFQPGKVGSSSILKMLQNSNIPCIQFHRLSCPAHFGGTTLQPVWESAVERLKLGTNRIISIVRDPLSRGYSFFWQRFSVESLRYRYQSISSLQEMYELLMDRSLHGPKGLERNGIKFLPLWRDEFEWFDEEMKEYLGMDVYQYPFNREKGYTVIRQDNTELFLLKMEKMGAALPALETFLGGNIHLNPEKENAASGKNYSMAYRVFRQKVRLKREYVDHYFVDNAKVDHFYTKEEQAEFLRRWKDNIE